MVVVLVIFLFLVQAQLLVISKNLTCNSHDLTGLAGFMEGLESPIDGWWPANSSSLYCCNWVGITCNSSSGRIVKLQLPSKRLVGHLSDSVSFLDQLTTLDLSHNFLSGPLPISLFHLTHLEAVDLSGNGFNRVLPVIINLPALQVLNISDNNLRGFLPVGLCVNSTRIRVLSFAVNYFTGTIPPPFGHCSFLEHLSVASNFISGIIPDFLLRLPGLKELSLEDNEFTSISGIGDSFSRLVHLDVSFNRLSRNIPDFFHNFPNLSYFSAQSNNLSGVIPPSLLSSGSISSLNLRNNSLVGSFDFKCSKLVNLSSLDLGSNNFSGTIPANLASCPKLQALNLAKNKLTGQIPESFKNSESLSFLSLSNCSFNSLPSTLKTLQYCPKLTVLILTMNFFTEQLPADDHLQFKALKALVIANCRLTGSIPSWLKGLTQLQLLDFSFNHLTGTIPAFLGSFNSLFYLDLSNNSFSGEIPMNITQLQSMISRDVLLEEASPDFSFFKIYRNMSGRGATLQYNQIMRLPPLLDLSSNLLIGPIWPEFGNMKKLHVLDLKHNRLSGTIPSSLSGMRNIETLDLSYNDLTGTIPPSLVKLNFLSKFSVAYNNLKGIIPSGGQLSTFSHSSFEGNPGLCGDFFVKCQEDQDSSQTPESEDEEDGDDEFFILRLLVLIGFGSGFLVTVISLIVVPRIR
ncbi:hypothetical protein SSX86_004495 [Deinandra increscens subsp. villosa]|uniref:Leucine-rich repeat-containing N-terminal plant-type domain-containing protein n=1 Tax=Deinandra increscens subsp. villosa TaxID=3103831 RepID=A0AAP0DNP0_9ASTR